MPRAHAPLVRLAAVETAAVAVLVRTVPFADPGLALRGGQGVTGASSTDLALFTCWWAAAACAAWTVAATAVAVAARTVPALQALRSLDGLAPRFVRRAIEGALVVSLSTAVAAPAHAATAPPPAGVVQVSPDGKVTITGDEPVVRAPARAPEPTTTTTTTTRSAPLPTTSTSLPSRRPSTTTPPARHRTAPAAPAPRPAPTAATYVVVPGDNLWRIARARIEATVPHRATDGEVVRYWRRLVDENRTTLRSGDPNLIFPGEILRVPPAL